MIKDTLKGKKNPFTAAFIFHEAANSGVDKYELKFYN
jgi:hypothetical protein